jgi:REP element-mobilizing transposase RayT
MPSRIKFISELDLVRVRTRGYLPHWEAPGATYAVTFRLRDAVPRALIFQLIEEKKSLARRITGGTRRLTPIEAMEIRADLERRLDAILDRNLGSSHMRNPAVAEMVARTLTHFEGDRYVLHAWTVMPNHVHTVVEPLGEWALHTILHSWKSWSSNRANEILRRRGRFWQREYFDRIIRDDDELGRTIDYVVENPIAAGLKDWRWTSRAWKT